jgi:hypothetical protein
MTAPIQPAPPANPDDVVWQIEDNDPENLAGGEVEYDFDAPDPEDG